MPRIVMRDQVHDRCEVAKVKPFGEREVEPANAVLEIRWIRRIPVRRCSMVNDAVDRPTAARVWIRDHPLVITGRGTGEGNEARHVDDVVNAASVKVRQNIIVTRQPTRDGEWAVCRDGRLGEGGIIEHLTAY